MIAEWDTNRPFLSDRLRAGELAVFADLRAVLDGVPIDIIPGTHDIWCRDFMPIELGENRYCQFIYDPDYLRGFEHLATPPEVCRLPFMSDYHREPIVLDGGSVVASRARVILKGKIYKENPSIERPRLREMLEGLFQAECIFIPKEQYDPVGHSDGVVRFVAEDRVLVNDYSGVDPGYGVRLRNLLESKGLEVETLPLFQDTGSRGPGSLPSAVGLYINYLRVGDVVVLPAYGSPEDEAAVEKVRQVMPHAVVSSVPCRSLAEKGGVLNCISWTVKDGAATPA